MKILIPILISLFIVSCAQEEKRVPFHEREDVPLYVELVGQCKDLEPPSSFKDMSSYKVDGSFWVSCRIGFASKPAALRNATKSPGVLVAKNSGDIANQTSAAIAVLTISWISGVLALRVSTIFILCTRFFSLAADNLSLT